jgi:hypothetical protein
MSTAIPTLKTGDRQLDLFGEAVKQNLDALTGQQRNSKPLQPLASTATLADVIAAVNVLIERAGR